MMFPSPVPSLNPRLAKLIKPSPTRGGRELLAEDQPQSTQERDEYVDYLSILY